MNLNARQLAAVRRTGQDVCVVAGPGSGKTRVLVERFAFLIEQQGVRPESILAITFTEKAATEIKQRLADRFAAHPQVRESIERAWVSTIDGFCARLLQAHAIAAGLAPDFRVLDQPSADRLARQAAEEALEQLYAEHPQDMRRLLEALDLSTTDDGKQSDLASALLDVQESMRLAAVREIPRIWAEEPVHEEACSLARRILAAAPRGEHGPRLHEWAAAFLDLDASRVGREHLALVGQFDISLNRLGTKSPDASRLKKEILPVLESQWVGAWYGGVSEFIAAAIFRVGDVYREHKRLQAAVDFADLAEHSIGLLEFGDDGARETCARFQHVLMDELQDTNRLQARLVELVRRESRAQFFGVGDVNQSIYGFRHADPEVFRDYRELIVAGGGVIDELDENYRSRQAILDMVSRMLDGKPGMERRELIAGNTFEPASGPVVDLLMGTGDAPDEDEARLVAMRIRELVDSDGCAYSNIAVLVRSMNSTPPIERAFDRHSIPFVVSGGRSFLEARETRDLLLLMAALVNPLDEVPLIGVLRGPLVGMSDEEIFRIGREGWQKVFEDRFGHVRRLAGIQPPDLLIALALDECGYADALPERARANIDKFLGWLRREHRERLRPLAEMLADLEGLRTARAEAEAPPPESGDTVRIMTIHAAKGLEFPVVFVSALQRGVIHDSRPLWLSAVEGLGIRWRNPVTGKTVKDSTYRRLQEDGKRKESEEGNRLLYVAMTRAEQRLILSSYETGRGGSAWHKMAREAFAEDLTAQHVEAKNRETRTVRRPTEAKEDLALDPPEGGGQYDSSVSVTDVALFAHCPRRYLLSRYLGLQPEPTGPGTGAIELGLAVHRALAGGADVSKEALGLKSRFEESALGQRASRAERVEREFDFLLDCEDVIVAGQIDLWFEEGGELVLVDYKTDRDEGASVGYSLQLRLYALALERYAGRMPDRAVLFYLRSDRAIEIDVSASRLDEAREAVRRLREGQDRLKFPLNEGEYCGRCPYYRGLCPAGGSIQ